MGGEGFELPVFFSECRCLVRAMPIVLHQTPLDAQFDALITSDLVAVQVLVPRFVARFSIIYTPI